MIHGGWKDSAEGKIVLVDWDGDTVGRLLEWLYTGDYESPLPADASLSVAWPPVTPRQDEFTPFKDLLFNDAGRNLHLHTLKPLRCGRS